MSAPEEIEEQEARAQRGLDDTREVIEEIEEQTGEPLTREQIREIVLHGDEIAASEDALRDEIREHYHPDDCACEDCDAYPLCPTCEGCDVAGCTCEQCLDPDEEDAS